MRLAEESSVCLVLGAPVARGSAHSYSLSPLQVGCGWADGNIEVSPYSMSSLCTEDYTPPVDSSLFSLMTFFAHISVHVEKHECYENIF